MFSERDSGRLARRILHEMAARITAAEETLARLDAAIGDGDHGAGMKRGLRAAVAAVEESTAGSAGAVLDIAGAAFADAAGGASGALVGMLFSTVGQSLGDSPATAQAMAQACAAGLQAVCAAGEASPGDKTLVDVFAPFVQALEEAAGDGRSLAEAWQRALTAAARGADSTRGMLARKGRAARLGERSLGHVDPGAASLLILLQAAGGVLNEANEAA